MLLNFKKMLSKHQLRKVCHFHALTPAFLAESAVELTRRILSSAVGDTMNRVLTPLKVSTRPSSPIEAFITSTPGRDFRASAFLGFLTPALISTDSAYLEERLLIVAEPMFPEAPITNTIGILIFAFDWVEEESTFRRIVGGTGTGRQCKIASSRRPREESGLSLRNLGTRLIL